MIKRPPTTVDENKYVTKEEFARFSNMVSVQFQKVLTKVSNVESLLQALVENQRHQPSVHNFEIIDDQKYQPDHYDTEREVIESLDDEEMEIHIQDDTEETVYVESDAPKPKFHKIIRPIKHKYEPIRIEARPVKKVKLESESSSRANDIEAEYEYTEVELNENEQINTVEETVETVVDERTGEILRQMFDQSSSNTDVSSTFYDIPLPTGSMSHLRELSKRLEEDPGALEKFKRFMQEVNTRNDGNFQKALSMIIADAVLFELNWLGFKGKNKMADMFLFQKLLYEEWFPGVEYEEYITNLKIVIKKAHKRYAKNQERKRARESQNFGARDPLKEAVKTITIDVKPE